MTHLKSMGLMAMAVSASFVAETAVAEAPPMEWPKEFKAEIESSGAGFKATTTMYASGDKFRTDSEMSGMETSTIVVPEENRSVVLMHSTKTMMEIPMDQAKQNGATPPADATWEKLGSEELDGRTVDKYKMTSGGAPMLFWFDPAKKEPVKMETEDGTVKVVYKSFERGPQDASLFEIPEGFSKMEMPSFPGGGGMPPASP